MHNKTTINGTQNVSYEKSDQILVLPQDWYVKKEQAREFALGPFGLQ